MALEVGIEPTVPCGVRLTAGFYYQIESPEIILVPNEGIEPPPSGCKPDVLPLY